MGTRTITLGATLVMLAVASANGQEVASAREGSEEPRAAVERAFDAMYDAFTRAYREADPDAVAALYAEDAFYLQPGSPIRRGRETIREGFARFLGAFRRAGRPGPSIEFEIVDRDIEGDLAYDIGYYRLRSTEEGPVQRGKFIVILKRGEDGAWRIHADGFSDAPAPPEGGDP